MMLPNVTAPDLHYGEKTNQPNKKPHHNLGAILSWNIASPPGERSCRVALYSLLGIQEEDRDIQHCSLVFLGGS